ncbi:MAG: hypothetical protein NTY06_03080 [Candidatus Gottesmanbacteria bacterium]|nr:hypothetical protein [Candidatus Gottesmanbacteria bacterium]
MRKWKRNVFIIIAILIVLWSSFVVYGTTFGLLISQNRAILSIAIILSLVLLIVHSCTKANSGALIAIFGILLALTYFMYQNNQDALNKLQALQIITNTNCELSKGIISSATANVPFLDRFSTIIYTQNQGFILNTFGSTSLGFANNAVINMDENKLLDLINELHVIGKDTLATSFQISLKSSGENTSQLICDKLEPIFLAKTPEFINTTFFGALYSLVRGLF